MLIFISEGIHAAHPINYSPQWSNISTMVSGLGFSGTNGTAFGSVDAKSGVTKIEGTLNVYDAERVNVNLFPIEEYAPEDYHPENSGIYIHAGDERISVDPENAAEHGWSPFNVSDDLVLVNGGTLNYWHKIIISALDRVEEGTRVRMEKHR